MESFFNFLLEVVYYILLINWIILTLIAYFEAFYLVIFTFSFRNAFLEKGVRTFAELERYGMKKRNLVKGSFFQGYNILKDRDTTSIIIVLISVGIIMLMTSTGLLNEKFLVWFSFVPCFIIFYFYFAGIRILKILNN